MVSPVCNFAKEEESDEIRKLAKAFEKAETVMVHSGDREPGATLSARGKKWVIAGLRLLADRD